MSGDYRDIAEAAAAGNARAKLALDVYAASVRHYLGAYLVELGGADVIVFTGGIGENSDDLRTAVCRDLAELGIVLDPAANAAGHAARSRSTPRTSRVQIWVMPTNEELVVARLGRQLAEGSLTAENRVTRIKAMLIAKVTGSLVATQKVDTMVGHKLMLVEPYRLDPQTRGSLVTTGR